MAESRDVPAVPGFCRTHGGRRVLLRGETQWFEGMAGNKLCKRRVVLAGCGLCGELQVNEKIKTWQVQIHDFQKGWW